MNLKLNRTAALIVLVVSCVSLPVIAAAQQGAASGPPLEVATSTLPKGYLRQLYEARLDARGGITPLKWDVTGGNLPAGIILKPDGVLTGAPTETGEFQFVVTVTDSGKPAAQRNQPLVLKIVSPLVVQWGKYPRVSGPRIEGSILVSNQTERDFDLTAIVMAVAENGRATAIGYQRIPLKKDTDSLEIPFGENLPFGAYELNADVVGEVAATNSIYRARLVPKEKIVIQQGP
jgi:hypothetical protein